MDAADQPQLDHRESAGEPQDGLPVPRADSTVDSQESVSFQTVGGRKIREIKEIKANRLDRIRARKPAVLKCTSGAERAADRALSSSRPANSHGLAIDASAWGENTAIFPAVQFCKFYKGLRIAYAYTLKLLKCIAPRCCDTPSFFLEEEIPRL